MKEKKENRLVAVAKTILYGYITGFSTVRNRILKHKRKTKIKISLIYTSKERRINKQIITKTKIEGMITLT